MSHFRPATDGASDLSDDEMDESEYLFYLLRNSKIYCDGTEDKVRALLEGGADVNYRHYYDRTPIMVAAEKQGSVRMMQILLDHGADLCARDSQGKTALNMAICAGCYENVKCMLQFTDKQNFLNLRDCTGRSCLTLAISNRKLDIAKEMIRRGADVNMQDVRGDTPLHQSMRALFIHGVEFLTTLLAAGSDVNQQNQEGLSPLMTAACQFPPDTFLFSVRSPSVSVRTSYSTTNCFRTNCLEEHAPTLVLTPWSPSNYKYKAIAFGSGFDPQCNSYDLCRIFLAARPHFEQTITMLLDTGADVNAVSTNNGTRTALSFLPSVTYRGTTTIFCMDAFLDKFARSSWVNPVVLQEVILHGAVDVIPKLIRCGLLPADIKANTTGLQLHESEVVDLVSPLRLALLVGNVSLARYFMDNLFLTRSDLSSLTSNTTSMTNIMQRKKHEECLSFFNEMSAQPMSLLKQAFVAVSSAVGVAPGRGSRIDQLDIPRTIKDCLQYNTLHCSQLDV